MLCLVCVTLQWHPRPFYKALATLLSSWVRARASASGCVYLAGNAEEKMSSDFRRFASACVKRGGTKVEPISASVMQSFIASRSVGRDACQKNGPMMLPYRNGIDYLARKRNAGYSGRRWARQATFHRAESSRLSRRRTVCKGYLARLLLPGSRFSPPCNLQCTTPPLLPFIHTNWIYLWKRI